MATLVADIAELLKRILRNLELTEAAFQQQINLRNGLYDLLRARLGNLPALAPQSEREDELSIGEWQRQWEDIFFGYYPQLTESELFRFKKIRTITKTTIQTKNRETRKILEENPALIDAIPRLKDLRIHLTVWLDKYDGLFDSTPEMCVLYVGRPDGVPFPRGVERSIRDWLEPPAPLPAPAPQMVAKPKLGEPCPQPTMNRRDLRNAIVEHFSLEELAVLCDDVQRDLEDRGHQRAGQSRDGGRIKQDCRRAESDQFLGAQGSVGLPGSRGTSDAGERVSVRTAH